ncbi:MAG: nucleotide sugar dehydrogenase [Deltaproteobacteria bacterium]|jgi:UDP-N-acetyl-D-galactosamine dehydrogenase|nr:nucleotide sugar dehydrogenase [Deltaproteobacteria bacterium]
MVTFADLENRAKAVAVVGLGYVGLPLAVAFARKFKVIGFDIAGPRVAELQAGRDHTREVGEVALAEADLEFTTDPARLREAAVIIVAVPTPIDRHHNPDLAPVRAASRTVGRNLAPGAVVVYESTVYPGVTRDECRPILEAESGLHCGRDFTLGYSPERINPGDKVHTFENIVKVVSGSDEPTARLLEKLYGAVVRAGIHRVSSIEAAEAAKVIENTQRDLNIALMNELAMIFERMNLDTKEVLEAAGSKWNFLKFTPGLVGGHCIGVDPYYLTFKAQELGYNPQVILAGRRVNDGMGKYVAESLVKQLIKSGFRISGAKVGIFGLTFKENVPDLRNTRVVDIVAELRDFGLEVQVHDPEADPAEARREYGFTLCGLDELNGLDAVVLAVAHAAFKPLTPAVLRRRCGSRHAPVCMDVKALWNRQEAEAAGFRYWRL